MSKILVIVLVTFFFALNVAAQSEAIKWQTDYKTALALSRETGKPILVDFWAKWCKPCQVLDEQFWTRADVVEAVKSFVPLKVDYDLQRDLAKQFIVRGLPYIAFSDSFGNLVTFRNGFGAFGVEDIRQVYKEMPKDFAVLNKAFKALESKKDDGAALLEIADYYAANKMPVASVKYYEMAYRTPDVKHDALKRETIAAKIGEQFSAAGSFYQAAYAFEDYLKFFPDGAKKESVYANLTNVYVYLDKLDEAEKRLARLKAEFPNSKSIEGVARAIERAKKEKSKTPAP